MRNCEQLDISVHRDSSCTLFLSWLSCGTGKVSFLLLVVTSGRVQTVGSQPFPHGGRARWNILVSFDPGPGVDEELRNGLRGQGPSTRENRL